MIVAATERLRQVIAERRRPLALLAAMLFAIGVGLSYRSLELSWRQVSVGPVLLILFLLAPMTLVTAALSLQLTARAVGRRIGFRMALAASSVASLAELMPLPGGAIVRGGVLLSAGAALRESTWIVTVTAFLTLFIAALIGGGALIATAPAIGWVLVALGGVGGIGSIGWIVRRSRLAIGLGMVLLRLFGLSLAVVRLWVAFAALGFAVAPGTAAVFIIATTLGSASSLAPAGLGVSEAIAAALGTLAHVSPGAAFLAVALNRVLGLFVAAVFAGISCVSAKGVSVGNDS